MVFIWVLASENAQFLEKDQFFFFSNHGNKEPVDQVGNTTGFNQLILTYQGLNKQGQLMSPATTSYL